MWEEAIADIESGGKGEECYQSTWVKKRMNESARPIPDRKESAPNWLTKGRKEGSEVIQAASSFPVPTQALVRPASSTRPPYATLHLKMSFHPPRNSAHST